MVDETPGADGVCPSCGAAAPSQLVEDARAKVIEECAKVCEAQADMNVNEPRACQTALAEAAAAIRSIAKGVES